MRIKYSQFKVLNKSCATASSIGFVRYININLVPRAFSLAWGQGGKRP